MKGKIVILIAICYTLGVLSAYDTIEPGYTLEDLKEAFNEGKQLSEPDYVNLVENFNNRSYSENYVCRHFARDTMKHLDSLGIPNTVQTGYYKDEELHAINVIMIPISNGEVRNIDYWKDWKLKRTWYDYDYYNKQVDLTDKTEVK